MPARSVLTGSGQEVADSTSLRNCDQDLPGVCFFCSTRWIALLTAVWMSPWCGPRICGFSRRAEVVKICPTGALLKNGFLKLVIALLA